MKLKSHNLFVFNSLNFFMLAAGGVVGQALAAPQVVEQGTQVENTTSVAGGIGGSAASGAAGSNGAVGGSISKAQNGAKGATGQAGTAGANGVLTAQATHGATGTNGISRP